MKNQLVIGIQGRCLRRRLGWLAAVGLIGGGFCGGLAGCVPSQEGLRPTPSGSGPVVFIDWEAEPLPEIPFPNDLASRVDPSSPTGLRLNFSEEAPTQTERDLRARANELSGFGIYAPITVRFDAPLDLDALLSRHGHHDDQADDAVYLVDVSPGSPELGQAVLLDIGGGRFPADLPRDGMFFANDTGPLLPACSSTRSRRISIRTASSTRVRTATTTECSTIRTCGRRGATRGWIS